MRIILILLMMLGLVSCADKIGEAKRRYQMTLKGGTAEDICEEGRRLVNAYLDAGDQEQYELQSLSTKIDCESARTDQANGTLRTPSGVLKPSM